MGWQFFRRFNPRPRATQSHKKNISNSRYRLCDRRLLATHFRTPHSTDLNANDGGPHAWDEAWAFWSGSEEGELGTGEGFMGYALAEQRCEQFGTCTGDDDGSDLTGMSAVNHDLLELYNEGQSKLLSAGCGAVEEIKDEIVTLMTVPLLQGLLRCVPSPYRRILPPFVVWWRTLVSFAK